MPSFSGSYLWRGNGKRRKRTGNEQALFGGLRLLCFHPVNALAERAGTGATDKTGATENMYTHGFIRYRHRIYGGGQLRPQPGSPQGEAPSQAAENEPRTDELNEQTPPLDSPSAPRPPAEHSENIGVKLLAAIREISEAREVNQISTIALLKALIERDGDEPWAMWWEADIKRGNTRGPAAKLAHYLKPFGVAPGTIREPDDTTLKGYKLESFKDAFSRYLPPKPPFNSTTP